MTDFPPIPIHRPLLPEAGTLLPYLHIIDEARVYTNFGKLTSLFSQRLAQHLDIDAQCVVPTVSGTSGLIAAVLACTTPDIAKRPLAVIPALTFAATAVAVERCGFTPYLVDVDPATWLLDPDTVAALPCIDKVGLVMPVSPYGKRLPHGVWEEFREKTNIPVVIDAAASFSIMADDAEGLLGTIPTVFSFHATKGFGIGEGGCIITTDIPLAERCFMALNFGFSGPRRSTLPGLNGKLSEYQVAVGLAVLDQWLERRATLLDISDRYRDGFSGAGIGERFFGFPDVDGGYALFLSRSGDQAETVRQHLSSARIEHRRWYDAGVHKHPYFSNAPRSDVRHSEDLGNRLIGLPMFPDLQPAAIDRIVGTVARS